MSVKKKITNSFVDDWKEAWKWLSVQAAVAFGVLATFIVSEPEQFAQLMESLPPEIKPLVGVAVALLPIYLRLKKQGSSDNG